MCPKGFESTGVHCIPNDVTRWTTPKFLLKDIMDGVLSRIIAVGAAAIIVLSLFVIVVLSCKRKCIKWAEQREMKRLAYEGKKCSTTQPVKKASQQTEYSGQGAVRVIRLLMQYSFCLNGHASGFHPNSKIRFI